MGYAYMWEYGHYGLAGGCNVVVNVEEGGRGVVIEGVLGWDIVCVANECG